MRLRRGEERLNRGKRKEAKREREREREREGGGGATEARHVTRS